MDAKFSTACSRCNFAASGGTSNLPQRLLTEDDSVLKCELAFHTRTLPSTAPEAYEWPSEEQAAD